MRSVVVGVDNSTEAMGAVAVGEWIAERLSLTLVLAHVVEDKLAFPYGDETTHEEHLRRAAEEGERLLHALDRGRLRSTRRTLAHGEPADALTKLAHEEAAAFVVVGSRGRGAVRAALFGSVSRALPGRCDCPVVVVPPEAARRRLEADDMGSALVCGVDGSEEAGAAAAAAAAIADRGDLELVLVHVTAPPVSPAALPAPGVAAPVDHHARLIERQREAAARIIGIARRAVAHRAVDVVERVERGDPASSLERLAVEEDAALICVGTHGRGPVRAALLGSTSATLGAVASRPVMIVPSAARIPFDPWHACGRASHGPRAAA